MKKALIVEDYSSLSEVYKTAFTYAGVHAESVSKAEDAIAMLKKHSYDILLVDLLLQEMTGLELLTHLNAPKNYPKMKVFVVTNLTNPSLAEEVVRLGAIKYFVKAEHTPKEIVDSILEHGG